MSYVSTMMLMDVPLNSRIDDLCRRAEQAGLRFLVDFGFDNVEGKLGEAWGAWEPSLWDEIAA